MSTMQSTDLPLKQLGMVREVKKGQTVLYQGEVPRSIYVLESGVVRSYAITGNAEEKTVALYGDKDFFPVGWMFGISPVALFYYSCMTSCRLRVIRRSEFLEAVKQDINNDSLHSVANMYISSQLHVQALGQTHSQDKILRTLQYLAIRFGDTGKKQENITVSLQLTQEDIAKIAGITRETTAIELNKLKKQGIFSVKTKRYTINMPKLLDKIGEDDLEDLKL